MYSVRKPIQGREASATTLESNVSGEFHYVTLRKSDRESEQSQAAKNLYVPLYVLVLINTDLTRN